MQTPLHNTYRKLQAGGPFSVGFLGGSITEGSGASDPDKTGWAPLVADWLKTSYPQADISIIQASIGGTGSDLGACRCDQDLLSKGPDLVFIEFAVNDTGNPDDQLVARAMEGIVRQILRHDLQTDIVFVYTLCQEMLPYYRKGENPPKVVLHQAVADHYRIPTVNAGVRLLRQLDDSGAPWSSLFADVVHPSDAGHAVYAQQVIAFLQPLLVPGPGRAEMPGLLKRPLEHGRLQDAWDLENEGWQRTDDSLSGRYPHMLVTDTPGAQIRHRFSGTCAGVYWLIAPDSGDIYWHIDDQPPQRLSSWDEYALKYTRACYSMLASDLTEGEHVLTIRHAGEKQPQSTGTWVRIGALLIA